MTEPEGTTQPWSRDVEGLFEEASALPTEDRAPFLDRACGDDAALRDEVDSLLNAHDQAGSFIGRPASDGVQEWMDAGAETSWIGRRVGNCVIQRVLGSGGMGTVFEAEQEHPRRTVALKVMRAGVASRSALRRFQFEVEVLGRLQHPGIARIYEAGLHDEFSVPYFAMELVADAETLLDHARIRDLGLRQRLELFAAVCDAVHHGHLQGVVHRDLKPGNILVDGSGKPRVIDFGIARATDADLGLSTMQSQAGQIVGTLPYMSPEQCGDAGEPVDQRSDVYSLGVVLYELLCGQLPHDLRDHNLVQAARTIREATPKRPSAIAPELSGDPEAIVMHALEKNPARRYRSAGELGDDIRCYLAHEPITARPPSVTYHLRLFARRNRMLFAAGVAVLVVLVTGVIVSALFAVDANRERHKAEQVSSFLQGMILSIDPEKARGRDVTVLREMLDGWADRIDAEFAGFADLRAELSLIVGQTYQSIDVRDQAERFLRVAYELRRDTLGERHPDTLEARTALQHLLWQLGRPREAVEFGRETLAISREVRGDDHPDTLDAWNGLVVALGRAGLDAEATTELGKLHAAVREAFGEEDFRTLIVLGNYAAQLHDMGQLDEAERMYRQCLQTKRAVHGPEAPRTLTTQANLVSFLLEQERTEDAAPLVEQHLQATRRTFGPIHGTTLLAVQSAALLAKLQGDWEKSISLYDEAVRGKQELHGPKHFATANAHFNFANVLFDHRELARAEQHARAAYEACATNGSVDDRILGCYAVQLGRTLISLGRGQEARPILERGVELLGDGGGPYDHWLVAGRELLSDL